MVKQVVESAEPVIIVPLIPVEDGQPEAVAEFVPVDEDDKPESDVSEVPVDPIPIEPVPVMMDPIPVAVEAQDLAPVPEQPIVPAEEAPLSAFEDKQQEEAAHETIKEVVVESDVPAVKFGIKFIWT